MKRRIHGDGCGSGKKNKPSRIFLGHSRDLSLRDEVAPCFVSRKSFLVFGVAAATLRTKPSNRKGMARKLDTSQAQLRYARQVIKERK